ncbi:TPA: hypothetical protein NNW70_004203 [Salmonella enterica]|nr:hypothetical protein [Salmonella enterica]HDI5000207.1 hypothetical protein [Salmonella enterica]
MFEENVIYDIETFPNVFSCAFVGVSGKNKIVFEISNRVNQIDDFLDFLRHLYKNNLKMIGFNNLGFDWVVVDWILEKSIKCKSEGKKLKISAKSIYDYAMKVIDSKKDGGFGISVKGKPKIDQIDLFKINHYDNKAKMTSLKLLEFNMRLDNINDLPFPVGMYLSSEQIDVLLKYNISDIEATLSFYNLCKDAIRFREELTEKYGFDCMNLNDSKIGEQFFMKKIEKENPNAFYEIDVFGKRKMKQTKREYIKIKECIFDYVCFKTPAFKALLDWYKAQTISETNGVFSDTEEHLLGELSKYAEMVTKKVKFKSKPTDSEIKTFLEKHPKGWIEEIELKATETLKDENGNPVKENYVNEKGRVKQRVVKVQKMSYYGCYKVAETINIVVNGMRYDLGSGGLHSAKRGHHKSTEDKTIMTWDVASYYPNMAIANRVYPEHLSERFCDSYEDFYNERKKYPKGTGENLSIKLGLNATYGNSNNKYSPFYDPKYTMSITINGQLSLMMLIERLILECNVDILMANSDGIEFYVSNDMKEKSNEIISRWEKLTGLQMEGDEYSDMWIRDVNSYTSMTKSGKLKQKGAYEYKPMLEKELTHMHKNHSALVVPMAVEHELLGRGCAEDFIRSHKDKFDFMLRTKVPRGSRLVLEMDGEDIEQQNICRYYVSEDGGYLTKIMPPLKEGDEDRRMSIESGIKVKTCNDINDFSWDINYDYYIEQADKLLEFFR